MITELSVDGFKSLINFNIPFQKGLNVLIGPNGAGKSNICQVLGLMAAAAEGTIPDYILSLGGTGTIFSKQIENHTSQAKRYLKVKIDGIVSEEDIDLKYKYSFDLIMDDHLKMSNEYFILERRFPTNRFRQILKARRKGSNKFDIEIPDRKHMGPMSSFIPKEKRVLNMQSSEDPQWGYLGLLASISYYCHLVREDLRCLKAINIDPYTAKKSSDILEPVVMLSDGRRLSNAIHHLFNKRKEQLNQINEILSTILPTFKSLNPEVTGDGFTRSFSITDKYDVTCNVNSLSDGTIKILGLLVGVLFHENTTAIIEEPENYLHPWACLSLVSFLRDHFKNGVCILTTHSETVLNCLKPSEILIIERKKGFSSLKRLSNERDLVRIIAESGFGCGYHYLAGSIGGVPT